MPTNKTISEEFQNLSTSDTNTALIARVDGWNFSKWTKRVGCKQPFDEHLVDSFIRTSQTLLQELSADIAYTQSDEISFVWWSNNRAKDAKIAKPQKAISLLASSATSIFNSELQSNEKWARFDCRLIQCQDERVFDYLRLRQMDAERNSVSKLARLYFSHKQLSGIKVPEMKRKIRESGDDVNNYPDHLIKGMFCYRMKVTQKFTPEEVHELPEKHFARQHPDLEVTRNVIRTTCDLKTVIQ